MKTPPTPQPSLHGHPSASELSVRALATPEPYAATVDLSTAPAGSIVTILVRGDTGLDNDPGEFSAIAVVIAA